MDPEVEKWLDEVVNKGTFENRDDAVEFAVFVFKKMCESLGITTTSGQFATMVEHARIENPLPIKLSDWKKFLAEQFESMRRTREDAEDEMTHLMR